MLRRLEGLIEKEEGILLVTGPTGSGKTTTLYSLLNRRNAGDGNIVTVEDPVEYRLPGINQVQVNERQGLTFAWVLRSLLRQDPDVIMVEEIRDAETADIACQAALTGHLVLSTLRTNDTLTAIARLVDMGVEPFKLASGLNAVTAQRLVRRVCGAGSREVEAAGISPPIAGVLRRRGLSTLLRQAVGCSACGYTGYRGRVSLVELLEVPGPLRDRIAAGAATDEIRSAARALGCLYTMSEDILRHLVDGRTTLEEVSAHLVWTDLAATEGGSVALPAGAPAVTPKARTREREQQPPVPETRLPDTAHAGGSVAVLAIGDPAAKPVLREALADGGHTVSQAPNGPMAIALVARLQPDLLAVGPSSPALDAAGTIDLVRRVLGMRDLAVLAVAATEDEAEALAAAGADDSLVLPLRPKEARMRLGSMLERRHRWPTPAEVMRPRTPPTEGERLADLHAIGVLDTPPEERFDRITRRAAQHFRVPIALVSLVDADRQWFKSHQGTDATQTRRDISFCGHAILGERTFVVEDAYLDARFAGNPLVHGEPHIRFYAGYPLRGPQGHRVGSFCIIDHQPRHMSEEDVRVLEELGHQVEAELATRAVHA